MVRQTPRQRKSQTININNITSRLKKISIQNNISSNKIREYLFNIYNYKITKEEKLQSSADKILEMYENGGRYIKKEISNAISEKRKINFNTPRVKNNMEGLSKLGVRSNGVPSVQVLSKELTKLGLIEKTKGAEIKKYETLLNKLEKSIGKPGEPGVEAYKIFENVKNTLLQKRIISYIEEIKKMNREQLLKKLKYEFNLSSNHVFNEKPIELIKYLHERLRMSEMYDPSTKKYNLSEKFLLKYMNTNISNNNAQTQALKDFFESYLLFSKQYLINKKFYGTEPSPQKVVKIRSAFKKNQQIPKLSLPRDESFKNQLNGYETNRNNSKSKVANVRMADIKRKQLKSKTNPSRKLKSVSSKHTTKEMVTLIVLLWMDLSHDYSKTMPNDLFKILRYPNMHFIGILFPNINDNNNFISIFKNNLDHPIISKLINEKILNYNDDSLTIASNFEKKIKDKFSNFFGIKPRHTLSHITLKNKPLIHWIKQYSLVSVDASDRTYSSFSHIGGNRRYMSIAKSYDPGIGFLHDSKVGIMMKSGYSKNSLPVLDYTETQYKFNFPGNNVLKIGYVLKGNKTFLKINDNLLEPTTSKKNDEMDPYIMLSKTFGDFMQILTISPRDKKFIPIYFATFDTMSAFIYTFMRKFMYKHNDINLLLDHASATGKITIFD